MLYSIINYVLFKPFKSTPGYSYDITHLYRNQGLPVDLDRNSNGYESIKACFKYLKHALIGIKSFMKQKNFKHI